jgi:hypothetical protein
MIFKKSIIFDYSFARSGDHAKEIGTNLSFTCPVVSTCWAFFYFNTNGN